jgi:hypothetical protein
LPSSFSAAFGLDLMICASTISGRAVADKHRKLRISANNFP